MVTVIKGWHRVALDMKKRGCQMAECAQQARVSPNALLRELQVDPEFAAKWNDTIPLPRTSGF